MATGSDPTQFDEFGNPIAADGFGTQALGGGGSAYSGASETAGTGAGNTEGAGGASKGTGSGFVNMDKYMSVNQAASQPLVEKISGKATEGLTASGQQLDTLSGVGKEAIEGATIKDNLSEQLAKDAGAVKKEDIDKARGGYKGPQALSDVKGFNEFQSGFDSAFGEAQQYATSGYQKAALDEMFDTAENKGKIGGYTSGMRGLDQALVGSQSGQIQNAVNSAADGVRTKKSEVEKSFSADKDKAVKASEAAWESIKKTAEGGRTGLQGSNKKEIEDKNSFNSGFRAKYDGTYTTTSGKDASFGDVVDDRERAIASTYDHILGGKTFDNLNKTYVEPTATKNVAPPAKPIVDQSGQISTLPGQFSVPLEFGIEQDDYDRANPPPAAKPVEVIKPGGSIIPVGSITAAPEPLPEQSMGGDWKNPNYMRKYLPKAKGK